MNSIFCTSKEIIENVTGSGHGTERGKCSPDLPLHGPVEDIAGENEPGEYNQVFRPLSGPPGCDYHAHILGLRGLFTQACYMIAGFGVFGF